jgi:hypothetical protein
VRTDQCTGLALGPSLLELVSGPVLPVLRLSLLSGVAAVFAVLGLVSLGSPAPGPVVVSGLVLAGELAVDASAAGRSEPPQPKLSMPPNRTSTSALLCIISSSIRRSFARALTEPVQAPCHVRSCWN